MVLQNKYKARASRRYNAARGGIADTRGRGGGGRGRGAGRHYDQGSFPSLNPDDEDEEEGKEGEVEDGEEDSSEEEEKVKYRRRKLESNAWRFREEEVDPHLEGDAESEPEVDLSGLLERVAKLDSSRTSRAISSKEAAESSIEADSQDIDQSLLYLLDRQRERARGKVIDQGGSADTSKGRSTKLGLSVNEMKLLEMEGKKLLEERDRERKHFGRAQMLKSQQYSLKKTIPTLNIGDHRREDHSKATPKTVRPKMNVAALYDDTDEVHSGRDDELDAFLQELGKVKESTPSQSTVSKAKSKLSQFVSSPTSHSDRQDHENFLDSII